MAKISLALQQKLKVTQLQKLTIQLMSLRGEDLTEFIHNQVRDNPLLDIRYHDVRAAGEKEKPIDNIKSTSDSLETSLLKQLRVLPLPRLTLLAAGLIIKSLDEKGFFTGDLEDLGWSYKLSKDTMEEGLKVVQSLDPPGIGAADIRECFLIQIRRSHRAPEKAEALVEHYYDDFLKGRWPKIKAQLDVNQSQWNKIVSFLKALSLQPIGSASQADEVYIQPDAEIYVDEEGNLAIRSLEEVPDVFFRDDLYEAYGKEADKKTMSYLSKAGRAFVDLETALAYRRQSIRAVLSAVVDWQKEYFLHQQSLAPLLQKDVAEQTGLSTATVSRVCRQRYVLFQHRTYPIQSFFAKAYQKGGQTISDKAIMKKIKALVDDEDPLHPYSDQALTDVLKQHHVSIARRTVTKFRLKLQIPNSTLRRQIKK